MYRCRMKDTPGIFNTLASHVLSMSRKIDRDAREGNIASVESFLMTGKGSASVETKRTKLLKDLVLEPQDFARPEKLFEAATRPSFDYGAFFEGKNDPGIKIIYPDGRTEKLPREKREYDSLICGMALKDGREETARIAAQFLAEWLRFKMTQADRYQIDLQTVAADLRETAPDAGEDRVREAIIRTQNALVDYVHDEGETLPLNRGAAYLRIVEDDAAESLSSFWRYKIRELRELPVDSLYGKNSVRLQPQYGP